MCHARTKEIHLFWLWMMLPQNRWFFDLKIEHNSHASLSISLSPCRLESKQIQLKNVVTTNYNMLFYEQQYEPSVPKVVDNCSHKRFLFSVLRKSLLFTLYKTSFDFTKSINFSSSSAVNFTFPLDMFTYLCFRNEIKSQQLQEYIEIHHHLAIHN